MEQSQIALTVTGGDKEFRLVHNVLQSHLDGDKPSLLFAEQ
ncbi:MAG: hypothetical protein JETT_1291 [Candidatus Jettenia ecosi]|uniref:Uncharacterized protein n=1 Tax=Candidatus Jettenia ecosi TaxID=2494326 RepID=A0A533QC91_9BACT|nr:MAG: hypothetical protein JETT_1291 [Candidatus Jettenia ecosi]